MSGLEKGLKVDACERVEREIRDPDLLDTLYGTVSPAFYITDIIEGAKGGTGSGVWMVQDAYLKGRRYPLSLGIGYSNHDVSTLNQARTS